MSKPFENEQNKANEEDMFQSDDDKSGKLLQTWNIKKRSMLPKGNMANTLNNIL